LGKKYFCVARGLIHYLEDHYSLVGGGEVKKGLESLLYFIRKGECAFWRHRVKGPSVIAGGKGFLSLNFQLKLLKARTLSAFGVARKEGAGGRKKEKEREVLPPEKDLHEKESKE